ncbi:MAG: O-antigen ligase family protein [Candidatus Cloacimonetes bacterium]|nr:O-antigen ligase family protein [Candidatus Cloacimonadota bacterium]
MKNLSIWFGILLVVHQFFYLPNITDSFYTSKWGLFSISFCIIYAWYLKKSLHQKDLKISPESKVLMLIGFLVFLISDIYHDSFYLIQTLGLCTFTYCMIYFLYRTKFDLSSVSGLIVSLLSLLCLLEVFGLAPFQGSTYHLSVFTGNPNLFAASLVFWFCIHKKNLSSKQSLWASFAVLFLLILSKSRAGIIAFLLIEVFVYFKQNQKKGAVLIGGGLVLASLFMIVNPYKVDEFSSLKIRKIEAKISYDILKENLWLGVGQGNYRKAYFRQLETNKDTYSSYNDKPLLQFIRLSEMSHFTPLSTLVSLGLPLGVLFLCLMGYFFKISYNLLEQNEFLALFSLCLMSMTYYLFHFSIILIPALIIVAKGLSKDMIQIDGISKKRLFPLIILFVWAGHWYSGLKYEFLSVKDYKSQINNPWNHGLLDHKLIVETLESKTVPNEKDFLMLVDQAHKKMPDPLTFYNVSKYFYLLGHHKKALETLQKGINVLPSYASYYYARALMKQDPIQAYLDYLLVLKIDRKFVPAWKNAAIIQLETGYLQEGLYSIKNGLHFYSEKNQTKNLPADPYYHQLLQIQAAIMQKIKDKK